MCKKKQQRLSTKKNRINPSGEGLGDKKGGKVLEVCKKKQQRLSTKKNRVNLSSFSFIPKNQPAFHGGLSSWMGLKEGKFIS